MRIFHTEYAALVSMVSAMGFIDAPLSVARPRNLFKRGAYDTFLVNNVFYYTAELTIGTPPQTINAVLDTGSSDLWVMRSTNPYCSSSASICEGKVFNPNSSSTFNPSNSPFAIRYGDYSSASGEWAHDDLEFAGVQLKNATFALANNSNSTQIVMGVGLTSLESTVTGAEAQGEGEGIYMNVPQLFKEQGYIERVVYSLWLDDIDSKGGNILFGAIDESKFHGELTLVPIVNLSHKLKNPYSFHIMVNTMSLQNDEDGATQQITDLAFPALLDSGTSFSYLPPAVVERLAKELDYSLDVASGYYTGSCDTAENKTVLFNFSGQDIPIPYSSLTMPFSLKLPGVCALVVLPSHSDYSTILGDVFLRNVYAVFDLENYQIGIAPAKANVTETDIKVVLDALPGKRAPLYDLTPRNISTVYGYSSSGKQSKEKIRNNALCNNPRSLAIAALSFFL